MRELTGYREAVAAGRPELFYEELWRGPVRDPELDVVIVGTYGPARRALDTRGGEFCNAATLEPLYRPAPDVGRDLGEIFHSFGPQKGMAFLDGDVHRERRRRARAAFGTAPDDDAELDRLVGDALTPLEERRRDGGVVDIVQHFIEPLAMRSSLQIRTGIPEDLAADLGVLLQGQVELLWGLPAPEQQRRLVKDLRRVWDICLEAIERNRAAVREGTHTPNIISGYLVTAPELMPADFLDIYGHVNAGYVSNCHTMSNIVVAGLKEPGTWRRLHEDPGLVPGFVHAAIARHSGTHGWFKLVAAEDGVELDGTRVARGTRVLVALNAANQAPDRGETDPILSFSYGPHICLGRDFSLRLLAAALRALTTRYPDARLAGEPRPWANLAFNGYPAAMVDLAA